MVSDDADVYYPVMLNLRGRKCLVVGGGAVAERKIKYLLNTGADVCVISKHLNPIIRELVAEGTVKYLGDSYDISCLKNVWLVFAATNDYSLNQKIALDCEKLKIFCNCVTHPYSGSFIIPAHFRKGKLIVSVATSGTGPALAAKIRDRISDMFPEDSIKYLEFFGRWRNFILRLDLDSSQKHDILRKTADFVAKIIPQGGNSPEKIEELKDFCKNLLNQLEVQYDHSMLEELWKKLS